MLEIFCGGYVKAWDVVNKVFSGKDSDGDGYYGYVASQTDDNSIPVKTSIGRIIWVMITPVFRLSLRVSIASRW